MARATKTPAPSPSPVASSVATPAAKKKASRDVAPPVAAGPPIALGLLPAELSSWDRDARGDILAVHIWTDVRPLKGAAGLLDWRLCGRLSSLIQSGRLSGTVGEQLLLPTAGRLPWALVMVLGLGSRAAFSVAQFQTAVQRALTAMRGLGVHDIAVAPPGRDIEALPPRRAVELLLSEARTAPHAAWLRRLTIVEDAAVHKQLGDLMPAAARA
jgi:hypothetical protein